MELLKVLILFVIFVSPGMAKDKILGHPYFLQFENCNIQKKTIYLSKKDRNDLSKIAFNHSLGPAIKRFFIECEKEKSQVLILSDLIRTHVQGGFIRVLDNKIVDFEIVKFEEPQKYKAPLKFIKKLLGNKHDSLDAIVGATLTRSSLLRMSKIALELAKKH